MTHAAPNAQDTWSYTDQKQTVANGSLIEYLPFTHEGYERSQVLRRDTLAINLTNSETDFAICSDKVHPHATPAGCSVFVPAGCDCKEIAQEGSGETVFIHFSKDTLARCGPEDVSTNLHPVPKLMDPSLGVLGSEIRRFFLSGRNEGHIYLEHLVLTIGAKLMHRLTDNSSEKPSQAMLESSVLRRLREYIDANLETGPSAHDLAEMFSITPSELTTGFRNSTGVTLHQYVMEQRIAKARQLLETSEDALSDIAFACGFSSQQHMTNVFSGRLGVPPGRYRKAWAD